MKTTVRNKIPLFDLRRQYAPIRRELVAAATRVLDAGAYVLGPEVAAFELEFARALAIPYCAGVASGEQALRLALQAAGVGQGDEVIVPAMTFVATASAVSALGATPVFADVEDLTLTLDAKDAARRVTPRTKAIIPVHLYGYPADMDPLLALAKDRNLNIIEDCAQAHLSEYKGRVVGGIGDFGCFSFYPSKNLGAAGDAGAVVTHDPAQHALVSILRNCGRVPGEKYKYGHIGQNARLDEIQAAMLRVKLHRLKAWTLDRRRAAARYCAGLDGSPLRTPSSGMGGTTHVYHLFVVQGPRRDELLKHLAAANIESAVYYPIPLHLQPAYASFGHKEGDFPRADRAAREVLALPLYPGLSDAEIDRVCEEVRKFYGR